MPKSFVSIEVVHGRSRPAPSFCLLGGQTMISSAAVNRKSSHRGCPEQPSFEHALFFEPSKTGQRAAHSCLPILRVELVRENQSEDRSALTIRSPDDAAGIFERYLRGADREHFVAMLLD